MAAQNNSIKTPKLLLERWAEIEARYASNGAPFHYTAHANSKELQNFYWKLVQKLKQEIQVMECLFTLLDKTTAQKLQNFYWNVMQKLKQRM